MFVCGKAIPEISFKVKLSVTFLIWLAVINSLPLSSMPSVIPITSSVIIRCFQSISRNPVPILIWKVGSLGRVGVAEGSPQFSVS